MCQKSKKQMKKEAEALMLAKREELVAKQKGIEKLLILAYNLKNMVENGKITEEQGDKIVLSITPMINKLDSTIDNDLVSVEKILEFLEKL